MKSIKWLIIFLCLTTYSLNGQGLFQQSVNTDNSRQDFIQGFTRGYWSGSTYTDQPLATSSQYGQLGLSFSGQSAGWARGFADLRIQSGQLFGKDLALFDLREAWAEFQHKGLSVKVGKQIIVWGRADGINPTDNLTPFDWFHRSPDPDDQRMGNWALRANLSPISWLRLEFDWLPVYQPSVYRFDLIGLPEMVRVNAIQHPENKLENGTWAGKIDLIFPSFEGSLSYVNGFSLLPALRPGALPENPADPLILPLVPFAFKEEVIGGDIAVTLSKTVFRAEMAWRVPKPESGDAYLVPVKELSGVFSADRSFGPLHLVLAYAAKYIPDFVPMDAPQLPDPSVISDPTVWPLLMPQMGLWFSYSNRILFEQTDEWIHRIIVRPSISLLHETLSLEASSLINITTGEWMVWPALNWTPADHLLINLGYQYYDGDDNTRMQWIAPLFSGPYAALRFSF